MRKMSANPQIQGDEAIAHEERCETFDFAFTLLPLVDAISTRLQCELSRFFFGGQIGSVRVGGEHAALQMLEGRSLDVSSVASSCRARCMDILLLSDNWIEEGQTKICGFFQITGEN